MIGLKYLLLKVIKVLLFPRDVLFMVLSSIMSTEYARDLASFIYCLALGTTAYILIKLVPKSEKAVFYLLAGLWALGIVLLIAGVLI